MLEESVMVNFKCVLSPSEMSDYYNCDFEKLQYKVILTEWYNNILQNSSTLTTKENQLTLKSLTEGWKYMITVHLQGNDKKLSAQSEFIYKRNSNKNNNQQDKLRESNQFRDSIESSELKESTESKESTGLKESAQLRELGEKLENVRICEKEYRLNIGMDENEFVTCKFNENDSVEDVVNVFMAKNKLKSFLKDSLIQEIYNLKSSNDSIKTIDLTDLI
ncbi:uncharacterized protein TA08302 [Theileria annulata]|uniref:Uncharacterized protein n=1 Tax=Theileria annulata TaxID=5874 RepID=Q4U9Q2_THEAN|nr:uncharacterized protein TA08302 [Theileria annulata]CAI76451.1 hypothetical protein, conserved [Theileria annulata]|eukprot:XP_953076.1 hypothetical protein, conserved [Theileria annulata]